MEVGLRGCCLCKEITMIDSFNPCFNGSWSESSFYRGLYEKNLHVSILVLMEVGLRVFFPNGTYEDYVFQSLF